MHERIAWWERLNRIFFPVMGPAQLGPGPGGERAPIVRSTLCPVCGEPLPEHRVERSVDQHTPTRLVCPAA